MRLKNNFSRRAFLTGIGSGVVVGPDPFPKILEREHAACDPTRTMRAGTSVAG